MNLWKRWSILIIFIELRAVSGFVESWQSLILCLSLSKTSCNNSGFSGGLSQDWNNHLVILLWWSLLTWMDWRGWGRLHADEGSQHLAETAMKDHSHLGANVSSYQFSEASEYSRFSNVYVSGLRVGVFLFLFRKKLEEFFYGPHTIIVRKHCAFFFVRFWIF